MHTIIKKPGSFGSNTAALAGSDRSGSEMQERRVVRVGFLTRAVMDIAKSIWAVLVRWQEREEMRQQLMDMDERVMRDIGLTRQDIMREIEKPFWRS